MFLEYGFKSLFCCSGKIVELKLNYCLWQILLLTISAAPTASAFYLKKASKEMHMIGNLISP